MIEYYWDGWEELTQVKIPPVENSGFKSDVLIREKKEAVTLKKPVAEELPDATRIIIR